jgi:hypothetical protein
MSSINDTESIRIEGKEESIKTTELRRSSEDAKVTIKTTKKRRISLFSSHSASSLLSVTSSSSRTSPNILVKTSSFLRGRYYNHKLMHSSGSRSPRSPSSPSIESGGSNASFSSLETNSIHSALGQSPCSSKKILGCLYLPSTEMSSLKVEISDSMYCALDIRELDFSNENPAENGFTWEALTAKPITEMLNGKERIALATVPCLVYNLATSGQTTDHEFLADFLRTYRYFASGLDVSRLLIMIYLRSYEIAQVNSMRLLGENPMDAEGNSITIKLRILIILKKWLADQADFAEDQLLCGIVSTFLCSHVREDPNTASYALAMIKQLEAIQHITGLDTSDQDPGSKSSIPADTQTLSSSLSSSGSIVADDSPRFTMLSIKECHEAVIRTPSLNECEGENGLESISPLAVRKRSSDISNTFTNFREFGLRYHFTSMPKF